MSTTESELVIETELGRVVEWRLRELRRAGYAETSARRHRRAGRGRPPSGDRPAPERLSRRDRVRILL